MLIRSARQTYNTCTQETQRSGLLQHCQLPDTFQSWFLITQLHLWMCMVRAKREEQDGHFICQQLVTLFWYDVEHRIKLTGVTSRAVVQGSTKELSSMFNGLLFAYDEGIIGDDTVLASALWRNLFAHRREQATAQEVAHVVEYVRRKVKALDGLPAKHVLEEGITEFPE